MHEYYLLNDDKSVTPVAHDDPRRYDAYRDRDGHRVGETTLDNGVWVSTVFLSMNHAFTDDGSPMIFETMAFPSRDNLSELLCWRYSTWKDALAGHDAAVTLVRRYQAEGKDLNDLWDEDQPESRDSDAAAIAAPCGDMAVPKDQQARPEGIAQMPTQTPSSEN